MLKYEISNSNLDCVTMTGFVSEISKRRLTEVSDGQEQKRKLTVKTF